MQGIEFDEDKGYQLNIIKPPKQKAETEPSAITRLLFKLGVSDQTSANYVLLGISVIFFGIAIIFFNSVFEKYEHEKERPTLTAREQTEQIRTIEDMRSPKNL